MSLSGAAILRKPARLRSRRHFGETTARLLAVILCGAVGLPAGAAQWNRIATGAEGLVTYYADHGIRTEGKLLRAQLLYDYREPQESPHTDEDHHSDFLSTTVVAYVDCKTRQIAVERMKNYEKNMARGKLVGQSVDRSGRKLQDVSAAADEAVFKWVCSRARR
jgi:hypothetical protein